MIMEKLALEVFKITEEKATERLIFKPLKNLMSPSHNLHGAQISAVR